MTDLSKLVRKTEWQEYDGVFSYHDPLTSISYVYMTKEGCAKFEADHAARVLAALDADALRELVEALSGLIEAHESGWPDKSDWGAGDRARAILANLGAQ